jgi:hypothetical protein
MDELIKHSPVFWQRGGNFLHWCRGCGHGHVYPTPRWTFNGNVQNPSFTPSMRIFTPKTDEQPEQTICHYFVTDGKIAYCGDSAHELKGQTLPLEPIPEDYGF